MSREIRIPQSCPECGGEVTLRQEMLTFPGLIKTVIFCKNCGWKQQDIVGDVEIEIDADSMGGD